MALVLKDRVKEQTTTTGTGTVTLGGAVSGFEAFSAVGDGNTTYYAIVHQTADEWEVGLGTYTAAGTLLSRDTILESTNSDAAVNFSAGTKDVFVTYPSDKAIYADGSGNVGIGTASPDRLFEVEEASGDAYLRFRASDTGGGADTVFENLVADNAQSNYIYFGDLDDTNIGIIRYNHASDFMSFTTNASERMRIDSSGKVGIGTSSPDRNLHVNNSTGDVLLSLTSSDSGIAGLDFGDQSDVNAGFIQYSNSDNSMRFRTGGSGEDVRIDSSGNVGIGVSTIDTALSTKLHVAGTIRTDTGSAGANPAIVFDHDNFADADANYIMLDRTSEAMRFNVNASERMRINSVGSVGIGNSAPSYLLDLYRSASTVARILNSAATGGTPSTTHGEFVIESTDANMGMQFLGSTTANQRILFGDTDSGGSGQIIYDHTSNYMALSANGSERMRIDSSGNLLVGTTSAATDLGYAPKLKLSGNGPGLYFEETDTSQDYSITALGGKFYIRDATAVVPRLTIDSSGDVGIGTTNPSTYGGRVVIAGVAVNGEQTLVIANNSQDQFFRAGINANVAQVAWDNADDLAFGTATNSATSGLTNEYMRIDSSGNVGIGTSSPDRPLTNAGNITATRGTNPWYELIETDEATTHNKVRLYMTGNDFIIQSRSNADAFVSNDYRIFRGASGPSAHAWYTGSSTERMRIDSSGNVGIGTTAPDGNLNVQRTAASAGWIINGQTVGVANDSGLFMDSSNNIEMAVRDGSGTLTGAVRSSGVTFFNGGDVGIGTSSPGTKLEVVGDLTVDGTAYIGDGAQRVKIFDDGNAHIHSTSTTLWINAEDGSDVRINYQYNGNVILTNGTGKVGIGTTSPAKQLHITKAAKADIGTLTDGATITPNFDTNQNFSVTLGGNRTLANPSNIDAGQTGSIFITQDGTGGRTLSFGSYWDFAGGTAPTLSTAAGAVDRIDYIVRTGTSIHAVASLNIS